MASLAVTWQSGDRFTPITCRATDDLPPHIKGTAYWLTHTTQPSGYYYEEPNQEPVPVEFINNMWYILHFSCTKQIFGTQESYHVDLTDRNIGLGCWNNNDPAHPDNQNTQVIQVQTTNLTEPWNQSPIISESGSKPNQVETWGPTTIEPNNEDQPIAEPTPLDEVLAATLNPIVSLQGPLLLDPPTNTMSVNVTTTTLATIPSPNGGTRGVPPVIFDGTCSHAEIFGSVLPLQNDQSNT